MNSLKPSIHQFHAGAVVEYPDLSEYKPNQSSLVSEKQQQEYVVITKSEYRRLNVLLGILLLIVIGILPGLVMANERPEFKAVRAGGLFMDSERDGVKPGVLKPAVRLQSEVHSQISAVVARVRLKQQFKNATE